MAQAGGWRCSHRPARPARGGRPLPATACAAAHPLALIGIGLVLKHMWWKQPPRRA